MKPKIIILKGLPASGKSTWAREQVEKSNGQIKRVNKDEIREMLDNGKWSKEREKFVLFVRDQTIKQALVDGNTIIVDDTNLHPKHVEAIQEMANEFHAGLEINDSFLAVPLRECIRRDALRPKPVGRDVINRMARQFGVGTPEPYPSDHNLPSCIICDLDGTLAHMGSRNPYDASTCEQDKVDFTIVSVLNHFKDTFGDKIFIFSGREDKYSAESLRWLERFEIPCHALVMRETGNSEKDVIIKQRMFEKYIRGKYNVRVVFDDRQQVVDGWRDLGLTVWQVAEGQF